MTSLRCWGSSSSEHGSHLVALVVVFGQRRRGEREAAADDGEDEAIGENEGNEWHSEDDGEDGGDSGSGCASASAGFVEAITDLD